jgi:ribosomal RNA-processing protein 17
MDLSRDGLHEAEKQKEGNPDGSNDDEPEGVNKLLTQRQGKKIWTREMPEKDGRAPRKKRKKFRYENKAERRFTRMKEHSKNSTQAKARRSG